MERLIKFKNNYKLKNHSKIKGLKILQGKNNFPISWLKTQGYCEYSLYLEYCKGISTKPTQSMIIGIKEHESLETNFKKETEKKKVKVVTFEEVLEDSKKEKAISREVNVISPEFGIRGFIDEIQMTPDEFIIIDDKQGKIAYNSSINQVLAHALAFKSLINDNRKILISIRERGTDNLIFSDDFDENNEKKIKFLINRVHGLFNGIKPFIPTKNKNKCNKCRFQSYCKHFD
ncbi:MAG: Dna2/Cas4 domain-containing protein [Methanobrevibacter sp.]|jgi:CRISPR/Cas system-associated exonuclease Cas4 (RecB family)|nr:Dna2/Cas4 domain-containing protein [Candidatus Methanovirga meridionalis]